MISLATLEEKFNPAQRPKDFDLSSAIPQSEDTGVPQYAFNDGRKRKHNGRVTDEHFEENISKADTSTNANDLSKFD